MVRPPVFFFFLQFNWLVARFTLKLTLIIK
jgi:hypothetical protein